MAPFLPRPLAVLPLLLAAPAAAEEVMMLFQWNPHWQCYAHNHNGCRDKALEALSEVLQSRSVDFANVVELTGISHGLPERWQALSMDCGKDRTRLIYDASRWQPSNQQGAAATGCMVVYGGRTDRPYLVQQFDATGEHRSVSKVVVLAAHFPHGHVTGRAELHRDLTAVIKATGVDAVLMLADTNENAGMPGKDLQRSIGMPGEFRQSQLSATCCFNDGFHPYFAYDRIMTNFGKAIDTEVLFDPVPQWGRVGEFHKALLGTVHLDGPSTGDGAVARHGLSTGDHRAARDAKELGDGAMATWSAEATPSLPIRHPPFAGFFMLACVAALGAVALGAAALARRGTARWWPVARHSEEADEKDHLLDLE